MKLKEAFRMQNVLTEFYEKAESYLVNETFENKKVIHYLSKAGISKDETIMESNDPSYFIDDAPVSFDVLVDMIQFILIEKEKLIIAIEKAKTKQDISFDALKQSNIMKQQLLLSLQSLKHAHANEVKGFSNYYGKDKDGKQAIYQYPTTTVISYDIDKNHLKAIEQRLRKECNDTSLKLDEMLICIDVDYECDVLESNDFEEVYRYIKNK